MGDVWFLRGKACRKSEPETRVLRAPEAWRGLGAGGVRMSRGWFASNQSRPMMAISGSKCEPAEVDPRRFLAEQKPECAVMGEGVRHHRASVTASGLTILPDNLFTPRAETVYHLGVSRAATARIERRALVPLYIRPPEAEERWERRQARRGGL